MNPPSSPDASRLTSHASRITSSRFTLPLSECRDVALVGGKALNLCKLIHAGLPVPGGFAITTDAHRLSIASVASLPADVADEIVAAWRELGDVPVAVRSSATAEDMAAASMAGQYETFLDIRTEETLLEAVRRCWASLDTPRTRAYLADKGIALETVAMAVVVQRLVPADVAGVLFTANPRTGAAEMVVEASWGLGESVVSGRVQPDVLRVDRATGAVLEAAIAEKATWIAAGAPAEQAVSEERRRSACLTARDVRALWRLGLRAAEHFGKAQDLEWAIHRGEVFLLQSRDVTTLEDAEAYSGLIDRTRGDLRTHLAAGHPGWVLHNLAETLPHPSPLTWSVIRRFMSGAGGFGTLYREAGFEPSERVRDTGFLTLVAGRVYMDLALAPEMFFADFPFGYDTEALRTQPDAGQAAPTVPKGSALARAKAGRKLAAAATRLTGLARNADRRLLEQEVPAFEAWITEELGRDLSELPTADWAAHWTACERRVLDKFAPRSLLPSLILGQAVEHLKTVVREAFWDEDADRLVNEIVVSPEPDRTALANAALYRVARGDLDLSGWLAQYGHRAPGEFDLAAPRWSEQPDELCAMATRLADGGDPAVLRREHVARAEARIAGLRARLRGRGLRRFDEALALARRHVRFREDGKDFLMRGYRVLRRLALEAGRRLDVGDDVFLLTLDELRDALRTGFAPLHLLDQRRTQRNAEARLSLPTVLDARAVETLGEPPAYGEETRWKAFAVSAGRATGTVRVVQTPETARELGTGYVLVCPSTDPAWTPLFINAAALVLERGGTLSHGAVVARELGLPAVVLPDATRMLTEGESVTVDGDAGSVARAADADARPTESTVPDPTDPRVASEDTPPVAGPLERASGRVRDACLVFWGLFLAAFFLLPEAWLRAPLRGALDRLLWPLVTHCGKVGTVALVAAFFAVATLVAQRLLTDNRRLNEVKRRGTRLRKQSAALPPDAPRKSVLDALAKSARSRVAAAAFVPLALLLGPMVLSFDWLTLRVDPASWNLPSGTSVTVQATVASDWRGPVTLDVDAPLVLDELTPSECSLPPVRETLERLHATWQAPTDVAAFPWDVRAAAERTRREMLADLQAYLRAGVPPETLTWTLRSEAGTPGRFTVRVRAGDDTATLAVVLGDAYPPAPREADIAGGHLLQSVHVLYPPPPTKPVFWRPFASLGHPGFSLGWLWVYVLVYVPAMVVTKKALRIP